MIRGWCRAYHDGDGCDFSVSGSQCPPARRKIRFRRKLKRNFVPDSLWGALLATPGGVGGHETHKNEKVVAVDVVLVDVVVEVVV